MEITTCAEFDCNYNDGGICQTKRHCINKLFAEDICYTDTDRIWLDGPFLKPSLGTRWNLRPSIPLFLGDALTYKYKRNYNYNPNPCYDPEKIISHDPATIIIWRDGSKTVVKCQNGEPYDLEKGIAMCYMKKVNGNKPKYYDIFKTAKKKGVLKDD